MCMCVVFMLVKYVVCYDDMLINVLVLMVCVCVVGVILWSVGMCA